MDFPRLSRRQFLAAAGVAGSGCSALQDEADTATPVPVPSASPTRSLQKQSVADDIAPWDLAADIDAWAWYPTDRSLWSRSREPYDFRADGRRWLATPTRDGNVRVRVENDPAPGNAGFYVDLGAISYIGSITVDAEAVHSDSGNVPSLAYALYLDASDDGDYFEWASRENREVFLEMGGDVEAVGTFPAGESFTIDVGTELKYVSSTGSDTVTYGTLARGERRSIDPLTRVALQVSVLGSGDDSIEEAIVRDITIDEPAGIDDQWWPMFNRDMQNTGHSSAAGPTATVDPLWTFETEGAVRSSPAVVDGTVYIGSDDGHVYAIDAATGQQKWAHQTDGAVVSSPAFLRHVVYVGSDDGRLYALTAATGKELWTYETDDRIRSSPTVQGSDVPAGIERLVAFGSDDGGFYALDPVTGEEVKTLETAAPIVAKPVIRHNRNGVLRIAVGSTDPAGKEYYWPPRDAEGYGAVVTIDTASPSHAALSEPGPGNLWYRADEAGVLTAAEFSVPAPTFETGGPIRTTPVVGDGLVYVGSWDGKIYAVEPPTQESPTLEQAWAVETGDKVNSSPAVAAGTLYAGSNDGHVYALDATTGEPLWTFETGGEVVSSPAVVNGTVYVGSNDGTVYALGSGS